MDGPEILRRVTASGLRGRGGGWFPPAASGRRCWSKAASRSVVANGAEGEPGSIKDRFVMMTRPARRGRGPGPGGPRRGRARGRRLPEGLVRRGRPRPSQAALRDAPPSGLAVAIRHGDDSYVAGEETAILETLEGRRAWPRPKPPFPAAVGFAGRPTLVQNVETLARVPAAVADPEGFRADRAHPRLRLGPRAQPGSLRGPARHAARPHRRGAGRGAPDGVGLVFPGGPSTLPASAPTGSTPPSIPTRCRRPARPSARRRCW